MKEVGSFFSNQMNLDEINTALVAQNFYFELQKVYGIKGTIQQKVYLVNMFLFSKLWYLSQVFVMEKK